MQVVVTARNIDVWMRMIRHHITTYTSPAVLQHQHTYDITNTADTHTLHTHRLGRIQKHRHMHTQFTPVRDNAPSLPDSDYGLNHATTVLEMFDHVHSHHDLHV